MLDLDCNNRTREFEHMAGHNKWSSIKHKKAKTDAQKGKAFSKVVREIMMAVKLGGPDPDANGRLRLALQKAKEVNMPADNVKRAIQKGDSSSNSENFEEALFEAYGPHGVAILIETLTDNRKRTVPNLRHILSKAGGNLATSGAVSYLFDQKGCFIFEPGTSEEDVMEAALSAGADDIESSEDGSIQVLVDAGQFHDAMTAFESADLDVASGSLSMIPQTTVPLSAEQVESVISLLDQLEDDDDVQAVHANFEEAA